MQCLRPIIFLTTILFALSQRGIPDAAKNPFVYLEENNHPYENHTIITEDGYILLVVRLIHGKKQATNTKRRPVIGVHGFLGTFYDFLNAGPERSIGFEVLHEGYDVWLLNNRGNTYSRKHVALDPVSNAKTFWNFSWHEVGIYDISATMDYVNKVTGFFNTSVIAYSQGGTAYFALAASKPEYDKRIIFSLLLAPVTYLAHSKQPLITFLKSNSFLFDVFVKMFNTYEVFPHLSLYTKLGHTFCNTKSLFLPACNFFLEWFAAGPSDQTDAVSLLRQESNSIIALLSTNHPAGGSAKEIKHYIQIAKTDKFQLYDYGRRGNRMLYNKKSPPLYNLSAVTSPVAIYYGKSDYFIAPADGTRMAAEVPNALHFVLERGTNHLDVMWGNNAVEHVHKPAIKLLNQYNRMRKM